MSVLYLWCSGFISRVGSVPSRSRSRRLSLIRELGAGGCRFRLKLVAAAYSRAYSGSGRAEGATFSLMPSSGSCGARDHPITLGARCTMGKRGQEGDQVCAPSTAVERGVPVGVLLLALPLSSPSVMTRIGHCPFFLYRYTTRHMSTETATRCHPPEDVLPELSLP